MSRFHFAWTCFPFFDGGCTHSLADVAIGLQVLATKPAAGWSNITLQIGLDDHHGNNRLLQQTQGILGRKITT